MDTFKKHTRSLTSPPEHGQAVTPSDAAELAHVTRALFVGTGGNLAVRLQDGTALTFANVPGGTLIPIRVARVLATGTTASQILGLWQMVALSLGTGVDADAFRRPGLAAVAPPAPIDPPRLAGSGRIGTDGTGRPGTLERRARPCLPMAARRCRSPWRHRAVLPSRLCGRPRAARPPGHRDQRRRQGHGRDRRRSLVIWLPPLAAGGLPDVSYFQHSGFQTVNASTDFTGEACASASPARACPSIPRLASSAFRPRRCARARGGRDRREFRRRGDEPLPRHRGAPSRWSRSWLLPPSTTAPELSGTGRIGEPVALDPGTWVGTPAPALALQWLRDGAPISGATAADLHARARRRLGRSDRPGDRDQRRRPGHGRDRADGHHPGRPGGRGLRSPHRPSLRGAASRRWRQARPSPARASASP